MIMDHTIYTIYQIKLYFEMGKLSLKLQEENKHIAETNEDY
jgi:hypothetical protein